MRLFHVSEEPDIALFHPRVTYHVGAQTTDSDAVKASTLNWSLRRMGDAQKRLA